MINDHRSLVVRGSAFPPYEHFPTAQLHAAAQLLDLRSVWNANPTAVLYTLASASTAIHRTGGCSAAAIGHRERRIQ